MVASSPAAVPRSGAAIAAWIDRLPRFWGSPASYPRDVVAVLLILTVSAATAFVGAVHTHIYGHDIFVQLDGGWRVLNGQRPEVDFSPGVGPLCPLIIAAGLKLAHDTVNGVGYASALVAAVVGLWGYLLCRKRMAALPAILAALLLSLIAAAPYPIGLLPNQLSHAMLHNRYGYALLGLVVLEAFQESPPDNRGWSVLRGASTGALCVILLLIKPSYGLVASAFAAISGIPRWRNLPRLLGILAGLLAAALAMLAYLHFDVSAIWNDFRAMAGARGAIFSAWAIRWAVAKGLPDFLWIALVAMLVSLVRNYKQRTLESFEPWAVALLVFIGQALLLATNSQFSGFPLNALLAIMLAEQGRIAANQSYTDGLHGFPAPASIILLLALLSFTPTFAANAAGLTYALLDTARHPPESDVPRFRQPHLAGLLLYDVPYGTESDRRSNGRVYVNYVNDGVELLRSFSQPDETIYTLDSENPFSYALLRRPPRGGASCMDFNYQFNDRYKPTPDRLFGAADIVMVPKHPSAASESAQGLVRNYLPGIVAEFRLCAESDWWELYKRPSRLHGCPASH